MVMAITMTKMMIITMMVITAIMMMMLTSSVNGVGAFKNGCQLNDPLVMLTITMIYLGDLSSITRSNYC